MSLPVGDYVPDFELRSHDGERVRLSSYRGRSPVVLVFYPFSFTGVCQSELCALRDDGPSINLVGATLFAISCDSQFTQARWAEEQNFGFRLLSDFWPHGHVARAYGVFNEALGCANRATFVIDSQGRLAAHFSSPDLATPRQLKDYEEALARLS